MVKGILDKSINTIPAPKERFKTIVKETDSIFILNFDYFFFVNINHPKVNPIFREWKEKNIQPYYFPLSNSERWSFEEEFVDACKRENIKIPDNINFYFQPKLRELLREMEDNYIQCRMNWEVARWCCEQKIIKLM